MKKLFAIALTALVLSATLQSCTKYVDSSYTKDNVLVNLAENLHYYILCDPVKIISDLDKSSGAKIFGEGFHHDMTYDSGNVTIDKSTQEDSCWVVKGSYSNTTYETTVWMCSRDSLGLCQYQSSGCGKYDEQDGYTANLASTENSVFNWEKSSTSTTLQYTLKVASKYSFETFKNGNHIETYSRTYSGTL